MSQTLNMRPSVDKGLRAQLADNLVTDELMDITDKLFTNSIRHSEIFQMLCPRKIVALIMNVLHLLTHRSFSPLLVTYGGVTRLSPASFKNKLTLRDEVLIVHSGGAGSVFTIEVQGFQLLRG